MNILPSHRRIIEESSHGVITFKGANYSAHQQQKIIESMREAGLLHADRNIVRFEVLKEVKPEYVNFVHQEALDENDRRGADLGYDVEALEQWNSLFRPYGLLIYPEIFEKDPEGKAHMSEDVERILAMFEVVFKAGERSGLRKERCLFGWNGDSTGCDHTCLNENNHDGFHACGYCGVIYIVKRKNSIFS